MHARVFLFAIIASTFFCSQVAAEDQVIDSDLVGVWVSRFAKEFDKKFAMELTESGLSESDAAEIIYNLSVDAANCFSDAMRQIAEEESADTGSSFLEAGDEGQLKHLLDSCFLTALANAGLTLDEGST